MESVPTTYPDDRNEDLKWEMARLKMAEADRQLDELIRAEKRSNRAMSWACWVLIITGICLIAGSLLQIYQIME